MFTPYSFTQRCVQDLAWVIHSPPLISGIIDGVNWWGTEFFQREYAACLPALQQLDTHPKPLQQAIADAKSQRLGHYFETLIAHWFRISPNYELLLNNHQLRTAKQTLGELDFLLRERASGKVIHLEVSVKFYLGTDNLDDMANWHGPGLKDRLDRKFQHLRTHQTRLAYKHPELMPHNVDETACLLKGRLFYPAGVEATTNFVDQNHLFGRWYELPQTPDDAGRYCCLGKNRWLANLQLGGDDTLVALPKSLNEAVLYVEPVAESPHANDERRFFLLPQGFWAGETAF